MNRFSHRSSTHLIQQLLGTLLVACMLLLTPLTHAQELQAIPPLTSLVVDQTNTLSATEQAALDAKLKAFETTKGSQIAVLMVDTTAPEDIFSYAQRAAETYKIGRANVGDGVLVVVAKNDRKMWIYTMRALEGAIPDLMAKRIIDEQMKPAFAAGNFALGFPRTLCFIIHSIQPAPHLGLSGHFLWFFIELAHHGYRTNQRHRHFAARLKRARARASGVSLTGKKNPANSMMSTPR